MPSSVRGETNESGNPSTPAIDQTKSKIYEQHFRDLANRLQKTLDFVKGQARRAQRRIIIECPTIDTFRTCLVSVLGYHGRVMPQQWTDALFKKALSDPAQLKVFFGKQMANFAGHDTEVLQAAGLALNAMRSDLLTEPRSLCREVKFTSKWMDISDERLRLFWETLVWRMREEVDTTAFNHEISDVWAEAQDHITACTLIASLLTASASTVTRSGGNASALEHQNKRVKRLTQDEYFTALATFVWKFKGASDATIADFAKNLGRSESQIYRMLAKYPALSQIWQRYQADGAIRNEERTNPRVGRFQGQAGKKAHDDNED